MTEQREKPTRVLSLGVEEYDKLEQQLTGGFELRRGRLSEVCLQNINRDRRAEVVVVGGQSDGGLKDQIQDCPMLYRSYVSVGIVTDKNIETASIPFDGSVTPPTEMGVVADIKHLGRITKLKRKSIALFYLSRTLADMEADRPTVTEQIAYEKLRRCKCDLEQEFNDIREQVGKESAYAMFDAVQVGSHLKRGHQTATNL